LHIDVKSEQPLFLQVARAIEDDILKRSFEEEEQVMSTTEISVRFQINPATAAKGVNLLVQEGILYKKRGVGMFVSPGAREKVLEKRREEFSQGFFRKMLQEAKKLGISKQELVKMIEGSDGQ